MRNQPLIVFALGLAASPARAQSKPRENDLKLPIGGTPGPLDAITDVAGVEVGHATLISGSGKLVVGQGPVRTGVTIVHPRGKANSELRCSRRQRRQRKPRSRMRSWRPRRPRGRTMCAFSRCRSTGCSRRCASMGG